MASKKESSEPYYPTDIAVETVMSRGIVYKLNPPEKFRAKSTPEGLAIFVDDWFRIRERIADASLREQRRRRGKRLNIPFDLQEL